MQVKQRAAKQHIQDLALEVAKQKEQLAAAMLFSPVSSLSEEKAAPTFYQNNMFEMGSYKPKRKRKKSTSLANGQDTNIFFPAGLGDKDELIRAQDNAKKSLQRKSTTVNSLEVNERGCDSKGPDDSSSVLDAVSGMITLSRRGSSDA